MFSWKEYNFPSGFLTNTILNFAQEWALSQLGSGLKSESSEAVNFIEKLDLSESKRSILGPSELHAWCRAAIKLAKNPCVEKKVP